MSGFGFKTLLKKYLLFNIVLFFCINIYGNQCLDYLSNQPDNELILVLDGSQILDPERFGTNLFALSYVTLASKNKLLDQSDPRLKDHDLIVNEGGLCGPTCLTNVYLAKVNMKASGALRYWLNYTQDLVREILDKYMWHTMTVLAQKIHDPRLSTYLDHYLSDNNLILESLGLRSYKADLKTTGYNLGFLKSKNALLIASVSFRSTNISGNLNHAIVILGVDQKSKKIFISDPNHPNQILISPYKIENGDLIFYLWNDTYVQDGDTSAVILESAFYITERI